MAPAEASELYAHSKGESCPVCGGTSLDRALPSWPENGEITAWVGCDSCRHVWMEKYCLSGYSDLEFSPQPSRPQ